MSTLSWAPDTCAIVFHSHRDGQFEIYRAQVDGSYERNLTNKVPAVEVRAIAGSTE